MKNYFKQVTGRLSAWENNPQIVAPLSYVLFAMLIFLMGNNAYAGLDLKKGIICQTMNGDKTFSILENKVSFDMDLSDGGRKISSESEVHSIRRGKGVTKITQRNGVKYKIHIADLNNPTAVDDFLSMTSPKGHEITYPLICE